MAWVFQSVTAKQSGSGAIAVNYPAGIQLGDTVFLLCARGFGSGITWTAPDFTLLVQRNTQNSLALFYRVIDGTEGATSTVTPSSNTPTYCMARFTGGPSAANFAASIVNTSNAGHGASTGLNYASLSIGANPNCLVLSASSKQASLTSYNIPAVFTGEVVHSITSDNGQSFVWDYLIQTTAADIVGGTYTLTGDSSAVHQEIIAAILPAAPVVSMSSGFVPAPGSPNLSSPTNSLQFRTLSGNPPAAPIPTFISGLSVSTSLAYGSAANQINNVGFIPQPGPGIAPFNNNQFLTIADGGTGNPSPTNLNLQGICLSGSVAYMGASAQTGQVNGIAVSTSTAYGQLTGVTAGSMTGIAVSASLSYGEIDGTGSMQGLSVSQSTVAVLGIGGSFQPLVPMTAVVDVRLGIGYQPWRVRPTGESG